MAITESTRPLLTPLTGLDEVSLRYRIGAAIRDADDANPLALVLAHDDEDENVELDVDRIVRAVVDALDDAGVVLARRRPAAP
jgi:hypothetical protein